MPNINAPGVHVIEGAPVALQPNVGPTLTGFLGKAARGRVDIPQLITIVTLMLMMASPIGFDAKQIAGPQAAISLFNPLYYIIACHQDCVIFGQAPPAHAFFGLCVMGFGMFFLGHWFFDRMKLVLVDNV